MNNSIQTIVYPVKNLSQAKILYSKLLGVDPYMDMERYVGFRVGDLNISLDPNGQNRGYAGPVPFWNVDDINGSLQILLAAGAQMHEEVRETEPGKLIASVKDADGNIIGLVQSP